MKRIGTVEDFSRAEQFSTQKRSRGSTVVPDPLEDHTLPMSEKHRLSSLWEVVQQNRQNHAKMLELVRPMIQGGEMAAPVPEKSAMPLHSGLQLACLYGDLNLVKMLVSRGESIDQVTMSPDNFGRGRCPMSVAAELGHNGILKFLIDAGGDTKNIHDPPLRQAVARNDLAAVTMLVQGGADPNPTLHQMLYPTCDINVVRMLLEAGAKPWGTMLLTALWRGCDNKVIELLLEFGAPFRSDLENESALEVAICRGANRSIIELLLKASAKWSPARHAVFPKSFQARARSLALCFGRLSPAMSSGKPLETIIYWTAVAEKCDGDRADLQRTLANQCDLPALEHRVTAAGFGELARHSEQSGNTSKVALLDRLNMEQLVALLWQQDAPIKAYASLQRNTSERQRSIITSQGSESTLDGKGPLDEDDFGSPVEEDEEDGLLNDSSDEKPQAVKRKSKPVAAPQIYVSSEGSAVGGFMASSHSNNRRLAHPVADSRNPNSPKPHHCTCCHVCHVSMKQRPRPIAACSQCNTIICKLCLQDRWKSDQWEEACATSTWVCHKCLGSCVCKACKSKGCRNQEKTDVYA